MNNLPAHIAIIMDGNGRWAKTQGKNRTFGHEKGSEVARLITSYCAENPEIQRLTLYAFSTENWKRPKLEVEFLMKLLQKYLKGELQTYLDNNIRFEPIGDIIRIFFLFAKNYSYYSRINRTLHGTHSKPRTQLWRA